MSAGAAKARHSCVVGVMGRPQTQHHPIMCNILFVV